MGLYLCVFADDRRDDEVDGVEVGSYDDFAVFRETVAQLEPSGWGSAYPVLMLHSDCDGEWGVDDLSALHSELMAIRQTLSGHDPVPYGQGWQHRVAKFVGHSPTSMADYFIDVDGEPLLERLLALIDLAIIERRPVTFA